jgi:hypothetical protein
MFRIQFSAMGYVNQKVLITRDGLTPQDLVEGLNDGKYQTTIQEKGSITETATGEPVGQIISVDNRLEYTDFDLTD